MKNTAINLQDLFLNNARKERIPVTIYLLSMYFYAYKVIDITYIH